MAQKEVTKAKELAQKWLQEHLDSWMYYCFHN